MIVSSHYNRPVTTNNTTILFKVTLYIQVQNERLCIYITLSHLISKDVDVV